MLPNYQRQGYASRMNVGYNKIDDYRSSGSLSHRVIPPLSRLPYSPIESKRRDISNSGERIRLMKQKLGNIQYQQKNTINDNNLYPSQLIFLLSNEEGNIQHMRKLIENQKKRVDRDFQNLIKQIIHIIEDLKLSLYAQLDSIFMYFITIYKNMKDAIIKMRQTRRIIIQNITKQQPQYRSIIKTQNITMTNKSNANILQQISKDQNYFKNHRVYQQITNAYYQAIGPIMNDAQNILTIGSQVQFYQDQKCNKILMDIRNNLFKDAKDVYDRQLESLVTQVKSLIEDHNMLLNGLNIQQPKFDRIDQYLKPPQAPKQLKLSNMSGIISPSKKKRVEVFGNQMNPYGIEQPSPKLRFNFHEQQNIKSRNLRPVSSTDNLRYRSKYSDGQRQLQQTQRRNTSNHIGRPPARFGGRTVSRDEQNIILDLAQSPILLKKVSSLTSTNSDDILLCVLFINDGKHIAVGSRDKNIYIHDVTSGKLIQVLSGHRASVCSLANFKHFFTSGGDNGCGSLILWECQDLKMKKKIPLHSAALTCIVDLGDGAHLATGGYDRKINIYNYKRGELACEVSSCKSGITAMVICQQLKKLVSSSLDSILTIWNIIFKNREIDTIIVEKTISNCGLVCTIRPLMLVPEMILVGNKDGKVLQINVNSGETIKMLKVGRSSVIEMAVIERQNKYLHPIIMSCCNGERQLLLTKLDTGCTESAKALINVNLGCGIGPKLVIDSMGLIAIVSQSTNQKQIVLYDLTVS